MGVGALQKYPKRLQGLALGCRPALVPHPRLGNWQGTVDGDPETWLSAACLALLTAMGVPGSCQCSRPLGFLTSLSLETLAQSLRGTQIQT